MLSKVALNNQNRICMEKLNAAPTVQLLTKQNPRKRRTLLPESLNCHIWTTHSVFFNVDYSNVYACAIFTDMVCLGPYARQELFILPDHPSSVLLRLMASVHLCDIFHFFLNPSPFYWSIFAKSEKWAFMYMRVRDAYFASVSIIVLFDFGIVLTVWDWSDSMICSDSVVLFWQCGIVLTVWNCSDSVVLFWQCGIVLTVWYCSDSVVLFWQYGIVLTVWDFSDSVGLLWQCGIVMTVWDCSDSVGLFWQCDIALTVWDCSDGVRLFWQYWIVLTIWDCFDSVGLFCQCGIVLTMWDCSDSVGLFVLHFIYTTLGF